MLVKEIKDQKENIIEGIEGCMKHRANIYAARIIKRAHGDVARFNAIAQAYNSAPEVTRDRLYLDNMQDVLSSTTNIVMDEGNNNMMYLPLDQIMSRSSGASKSIHAGTPGSNEMSNPSSSLYDVDQDLEYCQKSVAANLNLDSDSDSDSGSASNSDTDTNKEDRGEDSNDGDNSSDTTVATASTNNNRVKGGVRYGQ